MKSPSYVRGESDAYNISFPTNITDAYVWLIGVLMCWADADIIF